MGRLYFIEYILKNLINVPLYFYFKGTFFLGLILIAGTRYASVREHFIKSLYF